eukprot:comp23632_c1_seq1/m.40283 comp23632_c1_seq1/g.40283  ORF comp23632_c1_seq1/g.40283 comp23632_c1_seq1/m.40283 type:complete len:377 (+) comp23632_c1_seq1:204-1334(+)
MFLCARAHTLCMFLCACAHVTHVSVCVLCALKCVYTHSLPVLPGQAEIPVPILISLVDVFKQHLSSRLTVLPLVEHLLLDGCYLVIAQLLLQIPRQRLRGHLEIPLVVLEDGRLVVLVEVEGKHVRVLEGVAALRQRVHGLAQELHLDPRHAVLDLHLVHRLFDLLIEGLFHAARCVVVCIAVVVVQVALKGHARMARLLCLVCAILLLVKAVAVVPAAAVRLPRPHAHPAELVLARLASACHVVAATIFFDGRLALWALLCVCGYPVGRLAVIRTLLEPLLEHAALDWVVWLLQAPKAEHVTTQAGDGFRCRDDDLGRIVTARRWAPLYMLVDAHKGLCDKILVLLKHGRVLQKIRYGQLINKNAAVCCRASNLL